MYARKDVHHVVFQCEFTVSHTVDETRVFLANIPKKPGSNYINANYIVVNKIITMNSLAHSTAPVLFFITGFQLHERVHCCSRFGYSYNNNNAVNVLLCSLDDKVVSLMLIVHRLCNHRLCHVLLHISRPHGSNCE